MLASNIQSYVNITYFLIPFMLKIKKGNFIFLSSFRALLGSKGTSIYSASKAFGETFFQTLGKEYGPVGIYSNVIRLGFFDGKMTDYFKDQEKNEIIKNLGLRKLGDNTD